MINKKQLIVGVVVLVFSFCVFVFAQETTQDLDALAKEIATLKNIQFPSSIPKKDKVLILPENLIDEQKYYGYIVRVYKDKDSGREGALQISKGDSILFSREGGVFRIGHAHKEIPDEVLIKMGSDITKDGIPNLVVSEWSGEALCCYSFYVFSIGKEFKLLDVVDSGQDDWARFKDVDRDGVPEFYLSDLTFNYWHANLGNSPRPKVAFKYRDGEYRFAFDVMKKRLPHPEDVQEKIDSIHARMEDIRSELSKKDRINDIDRLYYSAWIKDDTIIPSEVWAYMLELIFTGHYHESWKFLDQVWPKDKPGKEDFIVEFKSRLAQSKYWEEIARRI